MLNTTALAEDINYFERPTLLCHFTWREVLTATQKDLKKIYPDISLCGPFGFELGWNALNAPKYIRRFYIYTNNPTNENIDEVAKCVQKIAFDNIRQFYPEIFDDFVLVIRNQELQLLQSENYQCKFSDKLLDIQVRDTKEDILVDYAHYIMLVYQSILTKTGDARNYEISARHRSRVFQLFIMLRALYNSFLSHNQLISLEESVDLAIPSINNKIQFFFDDARDEYKAISLSEKKLINEHVLELCKFIDEIVENSSHSENSVEVEVATYHVLMPQKLYTKIGTAMYQALLAHVIRSYENFVNVDDRGFLSLNDRNVLEKQYLQSTV